MAQRALARMQATTGRMPPPPNEAASPDEIARFASWVSAGMPSKAASDSCQGTGGGGAGGAGGAGPGCTPDLGVVPTTSFTMPQNETDAYICYGIDLPAAAAKRHVTAFTPRLDNTTIVHHMLLLQSDTSYGPGPTACNALAFDWKLLYAWAPGTGPHVLPPEAGFPLDANSDVHFIVQVHYNNLQGLSGESDHSGIDLCTTTDLRPHDADIAAFGSVSFGPIPAQSSAALDCTLAVPGGLGGLPITIFRAWPHMHQLGAQLSDTILHPGGPDTTLVDVAAWDFQNQIGYPASATVQAGDTIHTRCTWNNDTPYDVSFGENTSDEMCFDFVSYYPRIVSPLWNWLTPSYSSNCTLTVQ